MTDYCYQATVRHFLHSVPISQKTFSTLIERLQCFIMLKSIRGRSAHYMPLNSLEHCRSELKPSIPEARTTDGRIEPSEWP